MADLLITGGLLVDGTGAPARDADVAITGGRVEAIGTLGAMRAATRIDATGQVVCPGFVDVHTHSDLTLLSNPLAHSKIRQGVTTEVIGNCGLGVTPLADGADVPAIRAAVGYLDLDPAVSWPWRDLAGYFDAVRAARPSVHVAGLIGHLPLRGGVIGFDDRHATAGELDRMCGLLDDALDAGAVGVSTGLMYAPLYYAAESELLALARTAARRDRLFAWHLRNYADDLLDSVRQAIRIGEQAGCRTQISHLLAVGRRNWGKVARALDLVDEARERGVDVAADMYPYLAGNAPLAQLLPAWAQAGGDQVMRTRLADPEVRARIRTEWRDAPNTWDEITVNFVPGHAAGLVGETIEALAGAREVDGDEIVFDLLAEYGNTVTMVAGGRSEQDLLAALCHPDTVVGSDGQALDPGGPTGAGVPHPRSYGCYPRFLADYVAGDRLSLVDAVRKCTSAPATRAGLTGRGVLTHGAPADLVVFDAATITDRATFPAPQQHPAGISAVLVAGTPVVENGEHTGARPGQVLRPI